MRISKAEFSVVAGAILWIAAGAAARAEGPAPAVPRVEGGDPSVSGAFLKPYTNRWAFSIEKPGASPVEAGVWSDRMEATTYRGRPALERRRMA